MLDEAMEQVKLPMEIDVMSVYRAMEDIQDGRHKRGVHYKKTTQKRNSYRDK